MEVDRATLEEIERKAKRSGELSILLWVKDELARGEKSPKKLFHEICDMIRKREENQ